MLYWINKKIEKENIVILSKIAILLGSCGRQSLDKVEARFKKNASPVAVLGKNNLILIPFAKIQDVANQLEEPAIDVSIETPNGMRKKKLVFSDFDAREKCFLYLKKLTTNAVPVQASSAKTSAAKTKTAKTTSSTPVNRPKTAPAQLKPQSVVAKLKAKVYGAAQPESRVEQQPRKPIKMQFMQALEDKGISKKSAFIGMGLAGVVLGATLFFSMMSNTASLYDALQTQNIASADIESYLNDGADINYQGTDGVTPLLSAINHGKEDLVVTLVNKGADLKNNYSGETALDIAIASGLRDAVDSMLNKQAPTSQDNDLLTRAIKNKLGVGIVNKIILLGSNVNYINENGTSVLAIALLFGAEEDVVRLLLEKGASTSIMINGVSPAEFAQSKGDMQLASMLTRY